MKKFIILMSLVSCVLACEGTVQPSTHSNCLDRNSCREEYDQRSMDHASSPVNDRGYADHSGSSGARSRSR